MRNNIYIYIRNRINNNCTSAEYFSINKQECMLVEDLEVEWEGGIGKRHMRSELRTLAGISKNEEWEYRMRSGEGRGWLLVFSK